MFPKNKWRQGEGEVVIIKKQEEGNPLPYPHWINRKKEGVYKEYLTNIERYGTNIEYKIFYSVSSITRGVLP